MFNSIGFFFNPSRLAAVKTRLVSDFDFDDIRSQTLKIMTPQQIGSSKIVQFA